MTEHVKHFFAFCLRMEVQLQFLQIGQISSSFKKGLHKVLNRVWTGLKFHNIIDLIRVKELVVSFFAISFMNWRPMSPSTFSYKNSFLQLSPLSKF